ncbi:MAG: hypothetical protein AVDCRST_MAG41-25 [uncultured Corynebacteriales bacterium]|uniref:ANTAR domain-containing protein n=1 Tax=uncultured Mycobacteriales bacterium TaxID=581187 RepID=A0A6J4H0M8_9ACTN|nr:MAG: hypothetical protein AVDCRST_MAG41-25 [uncultured Corynebacteriales bacterium]
MSSTPAPRDRHRDDRPADKDLELQQALLRLGRLDLAGLPLGEVLAQVAALAKASIPGADEVSVTLLDGDHARSVAFTGALAIELDERQYDRGFGPCMDAAVSGATITIPDTAADESYADFSAVAARAGIRSSLSVGMPVPPRVVGGLNLYAAAPAAFDQGSVALARAFADYSAVALLNAALISSSTALAAQLQQAMASRATIEQAKGIIMGRLHCDPDTAFAHLVRRSQHSNIKLTRIAADVVADAGAPPTDR